MSIELDDLAPICPDCGYDLRGSASDRCPECGFDRGKINDPTSTVPWVHRRELGRVRAWIATVWRFNVRSAWLGLEVARPVSMADARRFWFVTATLLSLPWLSAIAVAYATEGRNAFAMPVSLMMPDRTQRWIALDLLHPWATGLLVPELLCVTTWLATLLSSGAHTYLFHPRGLDPRRADRAVALSYYLVATLVPPMLIITLLMSFSEPHVNASAIGKMFNRFMNRYYFVVPLLMLILLANAIARVPMTLKRTTGVGLPYLAFALLMTPLLWFVSVGFALFFIPWAIGYVWLTIDALGG